MLDKVSRKDAVLELSGLETDPSPKTPCICPSRQPHVERDDCACQADTVIRLRSLIPPKQQSIIPDSFHKRSRTSYLTAVAKQA